VLWVNSESPYKSTSDYVAALKAGNNGQFKMAGTGSKQEDQIITVALEKAVGKKLTYVPFKGGGDVAVQLVGKHVDSTVNNPIEAIAHWRSGALRPLCVFDSKPMPYPSKVTTAQSWQDVPTCKSQGLDVEYVMLRGIFMAPGVPQDAVNYYVDLFKKVRELPEWKKYTEDAAFNTTFMTGKEYVDWVQKAEQTHRQLMQEAGFLAK
jgi:tripartite-type tricarboxylate transporter receptor subunit TctC